MILLVGETRRVPDAFDEWVATFGSTVPPDAKAMLRRVFDEHGPVSTERAALIGRDHQLAFARSAVRLVGHDIATTTNREAPRFEYQEEDGSIRISYWGQYATSPIEGLTEADVIVEVADFMQDEVMDDVRGAWPECRRHQAGLHPSLTVSGPGWVCRVGALRRRHRRTRSLAPCGNEPDSSLSLKPTDDRRRASCGQQDLRGARHGWPCVTGEVQVATLACSRRRTG